MKNLPDKQYLVSKVGKKKDLPKLKKTSAEVISLYTDDGVDFGGGGTSDFNNLENRPKYNGQTMSGGTNIPEVQTYTAGDGISIENNVISTTGGGASDTYKYARIGYYSSWSTGYRWSGEGAYLRSIDNAKYEAWLEANPYTESCRSWSSDDELYWRTTTNEGQISIPVSEMQETTGLDLVFDHSTMWGVRGQVCQTTVVDKESEVEEVWVIGEDQFNSLGTTGSSQPSSERTVILGDGVEIPVPAIKWVAFNYDGVGVIPNYFLANCANLEATGDFYDDSGYVNFWSTSIFAEKIGVYFLKGVSLTGDSSSSYYYFGPVDSDDTLVIKSQALEDVTLNNGTSINFHNKVKIENGFLHDVHVETLDIYTYRADSVIIGDNFLSNGHFTNLRLRPENIVSIGNDFCKGLSNFTRFYGDVGQRLQFTHLEKIGNNFLADNYGLLGVSPGYDENSYYGITFPKVTEIGHSFMYNCPQMHFENGASLAFSSLKTLDAYQFMANCQNFVGPLEFAQSDVMISGAGSALYTDNSSAPIYATGVTIKGAGRGAMLIAGNSDSNPYRKLLDGGGNTVMICGTSIPDSSTAGVLGQLYSYSGNLYICTGAERYNYQWTQITTS